MRVGSFGGSMSVVGAAILLAAFCSQVQAQQASSNGYAVSASLDLLGSVDVLNVGPQAQVQFASQATGFVDGANVAALNEASSGGLLTLSTGDLTSETQFVAPTSAQGFAVVGTQSSATGVDVGAVSAGSASLLGVTANLLTSRAIVSGYCPPVPAGNQMAVLGIADNFVFNNGFDPENLQATGGSDGFDDNGSPGISVSVNGSGLAGLPLNPAANTSISLGGLGSLVLNEQNFTGDGISSRGMEANALHLTLATGLLNAEVIIAHSEAALSCP